MSTSPDSSAATRVGAEAITLNSTRSAFPSGLSHHSGFFSITVLRSGSRETSENGPVPIASCSA